MTRRITFAELCRLLERVEFLQSNQPTHVLFEHSATDSRIVLRRYRPRDVVNPVDLAVVRKTLDERGVMSAERFEDFTKKKPA